MGNANDVLIIGGGIIGASAAYWLAEAGARVVLADMGAVGSGCSEANAGFVAPSHSIPLAAPGVVGKALKWMFDPESPFYLKPRPDLSLLAWLWRFRAACSPERMRRSAAILYELNAAGRRLYDDLHARDDLSFHLDRSGLLELYATEQGFQEGAAQAALLRSLGVEAQLLDGAEARAMEPLALPSVVGGIAFPIDAAVDPAEVVAELIRATERRGAVVRAHTEVLGFEAGGGRITAVETTRGTFAPDHVVLAAGAWTARLARPLGIRLPLQAAKGYSITFPRPEPAPARPLLLQEAKVAVTPYPSALRFAGTLELAGMELSIDRRRVDAITRAVGRYIHRDEAAEPIEIWRGLRPCTPDGLAYLGRPAALDNLIIATGHAMKGVCQAPITGQLVADLICGRQPTIDLEPLNPNRFL